MILQALVRYYETLLKQGKVEEPGWSVAKVSAESSWMKKGSCWESCPCGMKSSGARKLP